MSGLNPGFRAQLARDTDKTFLDVTVFAEVVLVTWPDKAKLELRCVPHLNVSGQHFDTEAMFDFATTVLIGIQKPVKGMTITQINTTGQVWRVERVSENELEWVGLVCTRIDQE